MSERANIQARLNAGIDAVRNGDLANARRLLQQVISADPNNELAWMWMASAVTTPAERRACLERALKINPNNARAQEALRRLDAAPNTNPRDVVDMRETEIRRARRIQQQGGEPRNLLGNPYLILAGVVLVLVVLGVILFLNNANRTPVVQPTDAPQVIIASNDTATEEAQPTPIPGGPVVTIDPNALPTLPPTFTPTPTETPTITPTPEPTALPLSTFGMIYTSTQNSTLPSLFRIQADGSRGLTMASQLTDFRDIAVDPTGQRVVFVRNSTVGIDDEDSPEATEVVDEQGIPGLPQLFVAPVDDVSSAIQITRLPNSRLGSPSWSPDGERIVFASNFEGEDDIYVVSRDGGEPTRLTSNPGVDKDPAWSPDGRFIAYASDQDSPPVNDIAGSPEIYLMNPDGTNPQRLTNDNGDSYAPAWSPDSQWIVFVSTRSSDADLYLMDTQGQGENLLTFDDSGATDASPTFTPDGLWVAFISDRGGLENNIYVVDTRGDTVMPVTTGNPRVQSLTVLPTS